MILPKVPLEHIYDLSRTASCVFKHTALCSKIDACMPICGTIQETVAEKCAYISRIPEKVTVTYFEGWPHPLPVMCYCVSLAHMNSAQRTKKKDKHQVFRLLREMQYSSKSPRTLKHPTIRRRVRVEVSFPTSDIVLIRVYPKSSASSNHLSAPHALSPCRSFVSQVPVSAGFVVSYHNMWPSRPKWVTVLLVHFLGTATFSFSSLFFFTSKHRG